MRFITVAGLFRLLTLKADTANDHASANLSAKIIEIFTSPKFTSLDPLVDLVASAPLMPIPFNPDGDRTGRIDSYNNTLDRKVVQALFNRVRIAGPGGIPKRYLQQRCSGDAESFQSAFNSMTNSLILRTQKRGRRTYVLLGEGALKDEILLILADLYEKGSPREAMNILRFRGRKRLSCRPCR